MGFSAPPVQVDGTTLQKSAGVVSVKDAGISQAKLKTSTGTFSGTVGASTGVLLTLNPDAFWPMLHVVGNGATNNLQRIQGHTTDGGSADAPRFRIYNESGSVGLTYAVDYRYVQS